MRYGWNNRHTYDLKKACRECGFLCHSSFWRQCNTKLLDIWNGIGAEDDWRNVLIPDTIYGVDISLASLPHDWGAYIGLSAEEFHVNNLYFLYNANRIVRAESANEFMKTLRMLRTNKYYIATESPAGWNAFKKGKDFIK